MEADNKIAYLKEKKKNKPSKVLNRNMLMIFHSTHVYLDTESHRKDRVRQKKNDQQDHHAYSQDENKFGFRLSTSFVQIRTIHSLGLFSIPGAKKKIGR